jgi:hypothetical protein
MGLFRKGGGKLNGQDGKIEAIELTTKPYGDKTSDAYGEGLFAVMTLRPDNLTGDPIKKPVKIGAAEDYTVNKKRPYVITTDNADVIHPATQMGKFLGTVLAAGVSQSSFIESDDAQEVDFEPLVGARVRFAFFDDPEVQDKFGRKKVKNLKTGKTEEKDRQYFGVSKVYSLGDGVEVGDTDHAAAGKPNGKAGKAVTPEQVAVESISAVLKDAPGGKITLAKLPAKVALKMGKGHDAADAVQDLIQNDAWMADQEGWSYNPKSQELRLTT